MGREISWLADWGKRVAPLVGDGALVALKTAGGVVTSAWGARLSVLGEEDLVRIVDVDPIKSVLLFSGPGDPDPWAAIVALAMRYREDIVAAVWIPAADTQGAGGRPRRVGTESKEPRAAGGEGNQGWGFEEVAPAPDTSVDAGQGNLVEWSGETLRALRKGDDVEVPGGHRLVVGSNLQAVERDLHRSARSG